MLNFVIGLALVWVLVVITKTKATISGVPGIVLFGCICYGLGYLVTHLVKL